jgi:hypothetical protein
MKSNAGLWVDHREAIIVVLTETGDVTRRIQSRVEKQLRRSDESSAGSFEAHVVPADDSRERKFTGHLARYYDEIISYLRDVGSILICGPGEAKGELKKRFEKHKGETRVIALETADKMTVPQVAAQVRQHFHYDMPGRGVHPGLLPEKPSIRVLPESIKNNENDDSVKGNGPQAGSVHFEFTHPTARAVCIAGTFNDWRPEARPMHSTGDGHWLKELVLPPGIYEYCLVVDGQWMPDPLARDQVPNPYGGRNSILEVVSPLGAAHLADAENLPLKNANKQDTRKI